MKQKQVVFEIIGATREEIEEVLRLPEPPIPKAGDVSGNFVYDGEAWRLNTRLETDAAITPAGAPKVETGGYMIEQWVNNNRWRALYGPFETLEKAREVRERSKITPTRIVLQQKVVIEQ